MKLKILFFFGICFLFLCLNHVNTADIDCYGEHCYEPVYQIPVKIEEIIINAFLNRDSSITFIETIGFFYDYDFTYLNISEKGIIILRHPLPKNSEIYPNIKVSEALTGTEFYEVYRFGIGCYGQFVFNRTENFIELCLKPKKQMRIKIEATILSRQNYTAYSICSAVQDSISNDLNLVFSPRTHKYFMSVSVEGGEGVLLDKASEGICQEENNIVKISEMKSFPKENGFLCQGNILPTNKEVFMDFHITGKDIFKIKEREQKNLTALQRANIIASTNASRMTILNVSLTAILVAVTFFYAFSAFKTWGEMKKSNIPLVSAKLDPLGVSAVVLKIINIGNSTARNIKLEYKVKPQGPLGVWSHHILQTRDAVRLIIEDKKGKSFPLEQFVNKFDLIEIKSKFKDIHGFPHQDKFEINLIDYRKSIKENFWLWDTTFKEDIEQISKKFKELLEIFKSKSLKVDIQNINVDLEKLRAKLRIYQTLLKEKNKKEDELKKK